MKLLVTGGAGFIGSAVVRRAIQDGHAVVNLDALTYSASLSNVASVTNNPGYAFVEADLRDRPALDAALAEHQPDAIMHLAAESHVDRSIDGPGDFIHTNVTGTFNLLEAARGYWQGAASPRISGSTIFPPMRSTGPLGDTGLFTEETPYAPNSPYSASKAASDHLVRAWNETYGLPVVTTNCSNNYGPFHFPEKLIPVVILSAIHGREIPIYGDGKNVRDWLFVEDHAVALILVCQTGAEGRTYNIGGNAEATNIDLVRKICAILDEIRPDGAPYDRLITFVTDRPGHDRRYAIDASRIRAELGWEPSVTLDEGLRQTVQWFLDNEAWWRPASGAERRGPKIGNQHMILVFGQTGQVGRALSEAQGVTCVGRETADLLNPEACAALIREKAPSAVINAAAYTAVDKAEEEEDKATVINGAAPGAMAQAAAELEIPFVHISTDYVFDGSGMDPWMPDDDTGPLGAYGRSKLAGEEAVRAVGGTHAILRTSWVFSATGSNFMKTMMRLGMERDSLSVVDDQVGGPTYAPDIAEACLTIAGKLKRDADKSGTYHFSGHDDVSWAKFADQIFKESGIKCKVQKIETTEYPTPAPRPLNSRLDCSKTAEVFRISRPSWLSGSARS